jgi:predicted amidohydrolase
VALVFVAATLCYGGWALWSDAHQAGPRLRVAAIQDYTGRETGDLAPPPAQYVDAKYREQMTRDAAGKGAQLIVWSEESLGSAFLPESGRDPTIRLVRALKTHLVVGYADRSEPKPFNCAAIIGPDGGVLGVHHKVHLFLGESGNIQPGRGATAFETDIGKIGLEICFDSIYTDVTRRVTQAGAQVVAMPNFDPPTPHGVLHRLHDAMLPFRAVENHVPFVRSDSNGLSEIVDRNGRIVGQSPLYRLDELAGDIRLGDGHGTFFTRAGDWLAYVCVVLAVALSLRARRGRVAVDAAAAMPTEAGPAQRFLVSGSASEERTSGRSTRTPISANPVEASVVYQHVMTQRMVDPPPVVEDAMASMQQHRAVREHRVGRQHRGMVLRDHHDVLVQDMPVHIGPELEDSRADIDELAARRHYRAGRERKRCVGLQRDDVAARFHDLCAGGKREYRAGFWHLLAFSGFRH